MLWDGFEGHPNRAYTQQKVQSTGQKTKWRVDFPAQPTWDSFRTWAHFFLANGDTGVESSPIGLWHNPKNDFGNRLDSNPPWFGAWIPSLDPPNVGRSPGEAAACRQHFAVQVHAEGPGGASFFLPGAGGKRRASSPCLYIYI